MKDGRICTHGEVFMVKDRVSFTLDIGYHLVHRYLGQESLRNSSMVELILFTILEIFPHRTYSV